MAEAEHGRHETGNTVPATLPRAGVSSPASAAGHGPADALPLVLHLVTDLRVGGTQAILFERVRRPGPFRHAVVCFAIRTGGLPAGDAPDMAAAFADAGIPVHLLELRTARQALRAALDGRLARRVDAVVATTRPALIHSTLYHVHLLGAWMARRAGVPHLASKEGIDDWMGPLQRLLEARALRSAVRVAAVSRAAATAVRRLGVPDSRVVVIPNGIDPTRPGSWVVPPRAAIGDDGRPARWPIGAGANSCANAGVCSPTAVAATLPGGAETSSPTAAAATLPAGAETGSPAAAAATLPGPHLVGVGRLNPVKGWDDLLECVAILRTSQPGVFLDLLGSGTAAELVRLRARTAKLGLAGRVRFGEDASTPVAPDGAGTFRAEPASHPSFPADTTSRPGFAPDQPSSALPILVVPSREEGFGLVLLEGMARGMPIVATHAGGIPEVARPEMEAVLVPPRNPPALAKAIVRVHADPALAARLTENGRARVADFPVATMVEAYHRLYTELIDRQHRMTKPAAGGTSGDRAP